LNSTAEKDISIIQIIEVFKEDFNWPTTVAYILFYAVPFLIALVCSFMHD
jgi:hypothetical protein